MTNKIAKLHSGCFTSGMSSADLNRNSKLRIVFLMRSKNTQEKKMKISKLAAVLCLSFVVNHAFAADEVESTTRTENIDGTTTTTQNYDRDSGPGLAGFFFEPGIRYDNLSGNLSLPAGLGTSKIDSEGIGANLKLGFHLLDVMFLAVEGTYSQMHLSEDGVVNYSSDGNAHSYGPTLGFQTPWAGVRIWGTYLVNGEFDPASHRGVDLKFKDLNGYKVGAGMRFAHVGASVEYQDATYNEVEVQNAGILSGKTGLDLKQKGWSAQVSFPISL
jgi:hypothetical protein